MKKSWILVMAAAVVAVGVSPGAVQLAAANNIVVAALTPEQAAQCERERRALEEKKGQCTTDQCRQDVQREIDEHNARCQ